jgi:MoaA/NifB/PqqE/SkfB family radical SAM enzyme
VSAAQNAGHFQVDGTDRHGRGEPRTDAPYLAYRKAWADNPARRLAGGFPLHLDIESTNRCNLRCEYCTRNTMTDAVGDMDQALFERIIDEGARHGLASIKLNRRGEPLLHPQLPGLIRYAKHKGVLDVQFNTNAMLLTQGKARAVIEAGLDRIIFSLDGVDKATFEAMRPGAVYETVARNIRDFVALRNDMGLSAPLTRVQMTVSAGNVDQVPGYIALWRDTVNKIGFNLRREPMPAGGEKHGLGEQYPCPQLWQRMAVYRDGETVMCCGDWHKRHVLGNAGRDSIADMWRSEPFEHVRSLHASGRPGDFFLCKDCEYNMRRADTGLEESLLAAVAKAAARD